DAQGIELIEVLLESAKPVDDPKAKPIKELTWEEIKKRKEFIELENKHKKELEDKQAEFEKLLKDKELEFKREKSQSEIEKRVISIIDEEIKPSLSSDPVKAARQKKVIVDEILRLNPDL